MKKRMTPGSLTLLILAVLTLWYWSVQRKHADLIGVNEFQPAAVLNPQAPESAPPQFPLPSGTTDDIVLLYDEARAGGHDGIGISAYPGSAVIAVLPGTIVRIHEGSDSDGQVWLRTDDGLTFHYDHLQQVIARKGARLAAGRIIGSVGYEGLYFGVRDEEGRALDPVRLFESGARP